MSAFEYIIFLMHSRQFNGINMAYEKYEVISRLVNVNERG